jgi:glycosyltransferase involved in cell wall biosynthesis
MYRKRYAWLSAEKCLLIPNGYDEEDFQWLSAGKSAPRAPHVQLRLVHLGVIYPSERDPRPFFRTLARLKQQGLISPNELRVELRASGSEAYYALILKELDIADLVYLLPALPYPVALRDASLSDGLLLFQAANCDHQIPAKVYEYLRLGKPILALTSHTGDTAALLRETGGATVVDLTDKEAMFRALPDFLDSVRKGEYLPPSFESVQRYERRNQSRTLAETLSKIMEESGTGWQGQPERVPGPRTS